MIIRKTIAFIKRDFYTNCSYRFSFFFDIIEILVTVLIFFFIARLFGKEVLNYLKTLKTDYFSFVLIGLAFHGYLNAGLHTFAGVIRQGQINGTLETMLVTPTSLPTIVILSSLWSFISTSIEVFFYLIAGFYLGIDFSQINILSCIIILFMTILSFSAFGIISASFILIFKRGDPVAAAMSGVSGLLGGVYFPVAILPGWLQLFSYLLPITYSLKAMRLALLNNASVVSLLPEIGVLLLFIVITLPIGILFFHYAVKKSRIDGSLLQY